MRLLISYRTADPSKITLVNDYWALGSDGQWELTTKVLRDRFGIKPPALVRAIEDSGTVFDLDRRCARIGCGNPLEFRSRTAATEKSYDSLAALCHPCAVNYLEERRRADEQKRQEARIFAESIWLDVTKNDEPFDYSTLNLEDAALAYSLFTIHEIFNNGDMRFLNAPPVMPGTKNDIEVCTELYRRGFLRIGKETPLDAFAATGTDGEYKYFPDRIAWRFPMPSEAGSMSDIGKALRSQLDRLAQQQTALREIGHLWWKVALEDAYSSLFTLGAEYRIHVTRGNAIESAIQAALQKFSIPLVRTFIWMIIKDAAAYTQKAGVFRAQAANSISGQLLRKSDYYAANGCSIKGYVKNWTEEEPILITVLFDCILRTGVTGFRSVTGATFD